MKRYIIVVIITIALLIVYSFSGNIEPTDKAGLGKLLFFDPILSKDRKISCASCHKPGYAFADTGAVSKGVGGRQGTRNTPTTMNLLLQRTFFWDGRAKNLEEQALAPIENPVEMNLPVAEAIKRLQASKSYKRYFQSIFNSDPTAANLSAAIAAFERTLETSDSPFDNWKFSDDSAAVSDAVKKGFEIFSGKGKCTKCHFGADFTANEFRNIGLFNGKELNDSGRAVISGSREDIGKFKTQSLRNIAITAPYMHNGMFKTLEEVIEFYNDPGKRVPDGINRDTILAKPMGLTDTEKANLGAFLRSLTDKRFAR
jgi:cytochrome c peroxidase